MTLPRVMIVGDGNKQTVVDAVDRYREWLEWRTDLVGIDLSRDGDLSEIKADLMICFGGDGALLSAVRRMRHNQIPIAGVNYGHLGFLVDIEQEDFLEEIEKILSVRCIPNIAEHRSTLHLNHKGKIWTFLNDAVISQGGMARMIEMDLTIREAPDKAHKPVTTYRGDGLIISGPVGSTAYSMSAGGPIIHPSLTTITLTPLAPHLLSNRPLVVGDHAINVTFKGPGAGMLTIDGQESVTLEPGDTVRVYKSLTPARLVVRQGWNFYERLREKLGWNVKLR